MAIIDFAGTSLTDVATDLYLDLPGVPVGPGGFPELYATFALDPYMVIDGVPQDAGLFCSTPTYGVVTTHTPSYVAPEPLDVITGATARWLPLDPDVSADEITWQAHNTADVNYVIIQTALGGIKPVFVYNFSYPSARGRLVRPALTYNDTGYSTLNNPGTSTSASLIMVVIPHGGRGPYYNLFQANEGNPAYGGGKALAIRYTKGRISILQDNLEVVHHDTFRPVLSPMVIGVTIDAATNQGILVVIDSRRTSKAFSMIGATIVSFIGEIGSAYNYTIAPTGRLGATQRSDMDLLEVDFYNDKLSAAQLEGICGQLAVAYGVLA